MSNHFSTTIPLTAASAARGEPAMTIDPGRNHNPGMFTEAWGRREREAAVHAELIALAEPPADWMERALCAQVDPELFYPEIGGDARPARRICQACPVIDQCLQHSLDTEEEHGVWGGLTRTERRKLRGAA